MWYRPLLRIIGLIMAAAEHSLLCLVHLWYYITQKAAIILLDQLSNRDHREVGIITLAFGWAGRPAPI